MENVLEINDLCKRYKGFELKNVSFTLPKGYIMGFVGQNGSGKTTTIRSILNMANIDGGEIKVLGLDSVKDEIQIKQRTGVVLDSLYFAEHLYISEINKMLRHFYESWNSDKFYTLAKRFSLPDKKKVGSFSKGMKMKLMIACALSRDTRFLILDEPTSGLDPVARDELLGILSDYIEDGERSILFSTHITADVEHIADYVTVLQGGKVWFTGTKDELSEKYIIIKGDRSAISEAIKKYSIGLKTRATGFEAMLDSAYKNELPHGIEYEKADFDEILVYISREDKKGDDDERDN